MPHEESTRGPPPKRLVGGMSKEPEVGGMSEEPEEAVGRGATTDG